MGLSAVLSIYKVAFPSWEREPEARFLERVRSGRYRLSSAWRGGNLIGFVVTELLEGRPYGVLVYLAVSEGERGRGVGRKLCERAVSRFTVEAPAVCRWLLVEAEAGPARLYEGLGFRRLRFDYRAPRFDGPGEMPMGLLAWPRDPSLTAMDGETLRAFIRETFQDGYGLASSDPRIAVLCAQVVPRVTLRPMAAAPRFQLLPNAPPDTADVVILPVPHESHPSGRPGAALGPAALLEASAELEYYDEERGWSPMKHLRVSVLEPFVRLDGEPEATMHGRLTARTQAAGGRGLFIGLGGDHSVTPSLVAARMPTPGTVVFLDAHADLRPAYHGSPFDHACPAHRLREQGHRLVQVGIRSLFEAEAQRAASDAAIEVHHDRGLRRPAGRTRLFSSLAALRGPVYLSVDLDVFDPAVMPGVGTPQPGGIDYYFALDIFEAVLGRPELDVRGVDIVELVPEPSAVSAVTAAKLVQKAISFWAHARGYAERPANTGSQSQMQSQSDAS